ncbi:hypothetical protein [Haladaptatus halobius]|uniref:hypothetical protein n=1 Tax=Haladaptatus halobius TaxID=2884875 RepID=UPI001D0A287D|nr:hypothetical protein [Haladaptatus halobius]
MNVCSYCGRDIDDHRPVFVDERLDGTRRRTGQFCNYACLSAHIEDEELTTGACCRLEM